MRAARSSVSPDRRLAALIADICRRLDGIPLAIELASTRAAALGTEEVAECLDDRFRFLTGGRRTALARDQTLRAPLDWARGQGALSWELRAATSLARLLRKKGRSADGLAPLQPVYDRFTEGFDTADPKTAKALLDALQQWGSWSPLHTGRPTRGRQKKRNRDAINGSTPRLSSHSAEPNP